MASRSNRIRYGRPISFEDSAGSDGKSEQSGSPSSLIIGIASHDGECFDADESSSIKDSPVPTPTAALRVQSQTWKSEETRAREEFDRTRTLLRHYVPEQFKPHAKPSGGPANIIPLTFLQYKLHKQEMALEAAKQKLAAMELKRARKKVPAVGVAFNGKEIDDNFSTVLCERSVWSAQYIPTFNHPHIPWPGRAQLHEDGEKRENIHAPTRCGRFLPALRNPENGMFMQQYPIDQVGPLRSQGPTPAEAAQANAEFDSDPEFAAQGEKLLDQELMREIGGNQPPFVPDWFAEQRYQQEFAAGQFYQYDGDSTYLFD